MLRRLFAPLFLVVLGVAVATGPARAEISADEGRQFIQSVVDRGIDQVLATEVPRQEQIERFRRIFMETFDVDSTARFVLGRHWRTATEAERERFTELFREYNILVWSQRFDDYGGQQVNVTGTTPDDGKGLFVNSQVVDPASAGGQPINIVWRLRERDGAPRIIDIVVEGVSMALTYRSEYDAVVSRGGLSTLNDLLAEKVEQMRNA